MKTPKNYRMADYALKSIARLKDKTDAKYSDAEIIASAVTMMETISTIWNDCYKDGTSDIYEKFDIKDDAQLVAIMKVLQRHLGHYDHE